ATKLLENDGTPGNPLNLSERFEDTVQTGTQILPGIPSRSPPEAIMGELFADDEDITGTETVLLVEDEAFVRMVTAEVLESAGYRVVVAGSATEALENLEAQQRCSKSSDLLLADVVLPGMSGYELANAFGKLCPSGRVLLMTGYVEQLGWCGESSRGRGYLAKPFSARMLLRSVRAAMDTKAS